MAVQPIASACLVAAFRTRGLQAPWKQLHPARGRALKGANVGLFQKFQMERPWFEDEV